MVISMASDQTASIVVIVIGVGLLIVSVLADVIGVGDGLGFGHRQILGSLVGAVITLVGLGLYLMRKGGSTSGE